MLTLSMKLSDPDKRISAQEALAKLEASDLQDIGGPSDKNQ